jgi:hypothetical protein
MTFALWLMINGGDEKSIAIPKEDVTFYFM